MVGIREVSGFELSEIGTFTGVLRHLRLSKPAEYARRMTLPNSKGLRRLLRILVVFSAALATGLGFAGLLAWQMMVNMPGTSHSGPLPTLTEGQNQLKDELRSHVEHLASGIGLRSIYHPKELARAALYLKEQVGSYGYEVNEHSFPTRGSLTPNLEVTLKGTSSTLGGEIVVVGAHYDTTQRSPGADDNASGCAAVLALAKQFAGSPQARTIRFVLFPNEELPTGGTPEMGSWIYAKKCRADGDRIVAMLSLETIGYYTDAPDSQKYPPPLSSLYPSTGNFVAFVSRFQDRGLVKRCVGAFRDAAKFPSEGAALPEAIRDIGRSDHSAFWKEEYPALMVTDTANFRNPNYHRATDTVETVDFERLARVVDGLAGTIRRIAADVQN